MTFVLVGGFVALDLILSSFHSSSQLLLLVIEFVFESQEVFIERDTVTEKRFIATSLILLIDFLVLEHFDLGLHGSDLLVEVQDDIIMDHICLSILLLPASKLSDLVSGLLQVGMTLKFLVDEAGSSLIDVVVSGSILDICGASCLLSSSSSYSAYSKKENKNGEPNLFEQIVLRIYEKYLAAIFLLICAFVCSLWALVEFKFKF